MNAELLSFPFVYIFFVLEEYISFKLGKLNLKEFISIELRAAPLFDFVSKKGTILSYPYLRRKLLLGFVHNSGFKQIHRLNCLYFKAGAF